jgi:hypothetical protein
VTEASRVSLLGMKSLLLGILVGVAAGVAATLYWKSLQSPAIHDVPPPLPPPAGPASPHGAGAAHGAPEGGPHGGDGHETSFAKVHFMRKFVAALTEAPQNLMPSPGYEPLLKKGAAMIRCTDCHTDPSLDMEAMIANDPGDDAVQPFRMRRRGFMIPLMEKWVARLNKQHGDRLSKEVTCLDCHAQDPRDDAARNATLPPLMIRFVKALKEPPQNDNPAKAWKPLLKDATTASMLCATCHGQIGTSMEKNLASLDGPVPPEAKSNRAFMIRLMERWVRELNKRAKDQLVKAVACTDCHENDPRK